jgi:hypothetical protein
VQEGRGVKRSEPFIGYGWRWTLMEAGPWSGLEFDVYPQRLMRCGVLPHGAFCWLGMADGHVAIPLSKWNRNNPHEKAICEELRLRGLMRRAIRECKKEGRPHSDLMTKEGLMRLKLYEQSVYAQRVEEHEQRCALRDKQLREWQKRERKDAKRHNAKVAAA